MRTTAFITQFLKNATLERAARYTPVFCLALLLGFLAPLAQATTVSEMKLERGDGALYLSAAVNFELSAVVEDALLKGIPMFFVVEADVYRDRWYWYDKRVASATRTMRLAYQPLTRRWRLNIMSGSIEVTGLRASLGQNYDNMAEAIQSIQRISHWRIADSTEIDADTRHNVEFSFRLDLSQLPRPFQIGVSGQKDWTITVTENRRLQMQNAVELVPGPASKALPDEANK